MGPILHLNASPSLVRTKRFWKNLHEGTTTFTCRSSKSRYVNRMLKKQGDGGSTPQSWYLGIVSGVIIIVIFTDDVLFSVSMWIFVSFTLLTLPLQTFTILSAHLMDLYLCLPSELLVTISIFAANRPDMSSGLGGESTDPRRDMKTIEIKDHIIACGQKATSLVPRRSRSCNKTYRYHNVDY